MKWKPCGRPQALPDETFLPYCSKSKHWGLYVLRRCEDQEYSLDCCLPTKAKPEVFESATRYIASISRVKNNVTTHMAPDEGLHDPALFWYFYAAFLNKSLGDTLDSAKTFLFNSQQVLKDVLEAIHKHDNADLLALFTKDKTFAYAFDNLFAEASHDFKDATVATRAANLRERKDDSCTGNAAIQEAYKKIKAARDAKRSAIPAP